MNSSTSLPQTPVPNATSDPVPPIQPDKKKSKTALYAVIGILLILILALGGYVVYDMYSASEPEVENEETEETKAEEDKDGVDEEVTEGEDEVVEGEPDEDTDEDTEENATTLNLFFYKGPLSPNYPYEDIEYVEREIEDEDTYAYIISSLIAGPTADELSDDYISIFSLSGVSTCGGNSFEYSRMGDVIKVKLCKDIEPVMDADDAYAGITLNAQTRVIYSFERSLEFGEIGDVALFDKDGDCYAPDTGRNACTYGDTY